MKRILLILSVYSVTASVCFAQTHLTLTKGWRYQPSDQAAFASPNVSDQSWKPIQVGKPWEEQGLTDYNGVVWYRLHIVIPSSLRNQTPLRSGLRLALGRIDDNDQTYVNGKEVGRTSGWDVSREYIIPDEFIRWDADNVIAVRAEDVYGNGGLTRGPYEIGGVPSLATLYTLFSSERPSLLTGQGSQTLAKSVQFQLKIPCQPLAGSMRTIVTNTMTKAMVYDETKPLTLDGQHPVTYKYLVPITGNGSYLASHAFEVPGLHDTLRYSTLIGYQGRERANDHLAFPVVAQQVPDKVTAFPLEHIHFAGFLEQRLNANLTQRLLKIDEEGILEGFYNRPGSQTWVGEYPGKYLHAASRVWRYSNNPQLKTQMDRIVDVLIGTQLPSGYLGTYAPDQYWKAWDVWAHKYDLLGLLSYYAATGYEPALEASRRIGDLLLKTFGAGPGQLNIVETGDHVGMASASVLEPMTELYRYTGDKRYLDFCKYIIQAYDTPKGPKLITTLNTIGKVDKTANAKAYEMMSNLIGIVRLYQLTGEPSLLKAAQTAWQDIATHKLYITGTASAHEHFQPDGVLPAENRDSMGEGCVTTTWLQLSQALYGLTGEARYVDEMEKSIFNHLFAAENPQTGCVSYYTALMGRKPYRCTITAHCCLASVPRGFAIIPELAYTRNRDNGLNINLYSAGTVQDSVRTSDGRMVPVQLTIATGFPADGRVKITLTSPQQASFRLALYVPAWAKSYRASSQGKTWEGVPGTYVTIDQIWDKSASVDVSFDHHPQVLDGGISYPGRIALKVGPQVLALDQALNPGLTDVQEVTLEDTILKSLPATILPVGWVGSQVYSVTGKIDGKRVLLKLVPFAEAGQTGGELAVWLRTISH
ncbi:glycoside hydrolase family 127 protein [Spirosoma panaciterrae]|uniref:glycoside hydrolase family 127 protein n=1 Tax=Spirosoma panaciterrae TaxID=496058 RepID=UPI00035D23A7|nr:beta-L-arabinofuranosidase domain-containing protein [Spirosoma panaciterrae]